MAEEHLPAELKIDATEPEVHVPMYLDRWDKYGFRFYYGPFVKPRGADGRDVADYDQTQDFDFAEKSGHAGLVMWENANGQDTAEGIMDTSKWSWVLDEAKKRGLPIGVNFGMQQLCWMFNRQRDQQLQGQPQYLGGWYGLLPFSPMLLSWNAAHAEDQALVQLQRTVRRFNDVDNIVSWMEPHEEMGHGAADVFVDYSPQADIGYREFLQSKYGGLDVVARRWGSELRSWDDVHVPELASFLGWNKEAVDLTGAWHVSFQAPYDESSAAPQLDDSAWPTIVAPGNPTALYLPRSAAVYRRHIHIDPAWRAAHDHVWLYVWDLNDNRGLGNAGWHLPPGKFVKVYVNGKDVTEVPEHKEEHRSAVDVSSALTAGDNLITVLLPWGLFDYRDYLSPHPPKQYPDLGPQMNARWADFSDWNAWCRGRAVRRGVRRIRQIDPNRPVTLASPDSYMSEMKAIAEDYGGLFHNTGYMAGFWANWHCMYMVNSGLATDVEPGSGAVDLPDFKRFMGRWSTEGLQGVDYFQHIGDILWNASIRDYFRQTINLWHLMGKYHTPKAEAAALISDRMGRLLGFPWHPDPAIVQRGGIVPVRINEWLLDSFPVDAIVENDFARGNVDSYKVVVDTNTMIMDKPLIADVEKWVRAGGIFVTFGQSGRHTSTAIDSWPIGQLTGYAVVQTNITNSAINLAPGQPVFKDDFWVKARRASGLGLKKTLPECQDLMVWDNGATAMGMRPLGKGCVIDLGATPEAPRLLRDILNWARLQTIPASTAAKDVLMRHFVSNNGLYDVWAMWNQKDAPMTTDLVFRNGLRPTTAIDVKTGSPVAVQGGADGVKIPGVQLDNWETRVFLTFRSAIVGFGGELPSAVHNAAHDRILSRMHGIVERKIVIAPQNGRDAPEAIKMLWASRWTASPLGSKNLHQFWIDTWLRSPPRDHPDS